MLAQLIEHRLYPDFKLTVPSSMPAHMVERLAGLTLDGLFKTIWFLGHCVAEFDTCAVGHGRAQLKGANADRVIENAFSILSHWPHSLGERLAVIAAQPRGSKKASLYRNALGPVATYMDKEIAGGELAFLRSTYEFHIRSIWRDLGRNPLQRFDERQLELNFAADSVPLSKERL
jgi:hypothetical protein